MTPRSAYRLRCHPAGTGFARAWDEALVCGAARLTAIALERATVGGVREVWRDGQIVSEVRAPSDRLLIFLLQHLAPHQFGGTPSPDDRAANAQAGFDDRLAALADIDTAADPLTPAEYRTPTREPRDPYPADEHRR